MSEIKDMIYFSRDIGNAFKNSKHEYLWEFTIDEKRVCIQFFISYLTSRRKIAYNQKVIREEPWFENLYSYEFIIDGHTYKVHQTIDISDLFIDGESFNHYYTLEKNKKEFSENEKPTSNIIRPESYIVDDGAGNGGEIKRSNEINFIKNEKPKKIVNLSFKIDFNKNKENNLKNFKFPSKENNLYNKNDNCNDFENGKEINNKNNIIFKNNHDIINKNFNDLIDLDDDVIDSNRNINDSQNNYNSQNNNNNFNNFQNNNPKSNNFNNLNFNNMNNYYNNANDSKNNNDLLDFNNFDNNDLNHNYKANKNSNNFQNNNNNNSNNNQNYNNYNCNNNFNSNFNNNNFGYNNNCNINSNINNSNNNYNNNILNYKDKKDEDIDNIDINYYGF